MDACDVYDHIEWESYASVYLDICTVYWYTVNKSRNINYISIVLENLERSRLL